MSDISLPWNGDVQVDDTGDILFVSGNAEIQEHVIRRVLTNPAIIINGSTDVEADYTHHIDYGGGARSFVGKRVTPNLLAQVKNLMTDQIQQEANIDHTVIPAVTVTQIQGGIAVSATVAAQTGGLVAIPQIDITA